MFDSRTSRLAALFFMLLTACSAHAAEFSFNDLMQQLAKQKTSRATFTERKFLSVVDQPLESSGELSFTAPDKLEKRTLKPKAESLVLEGDMLTVVQNGKRRAQIKLSSHPEAAAFVESIRATLNGDEESLKRHYKIDVSGKPEQWKLQLVPVSEKMQAIISRIRMEGGTQSIRSIVFEMPDGDHTEMSIQPVAAP